MLVFRFVSLYSQNSVELKSSGNEFKIVAENSLRNREDNFTGGKVFFRYYNIRLNLQNINYIFQ